MAIRLKRGRPAARALARVVAKEFEKAIEDLGRRKGVSRAEAVHEARQSVKKARAVLHLLKQNLGRDYRVLDGRLRSLAHRLSSLRDADASPEIITRAKCDPPRTLVFAPSRVRDCQQ